MKDANEGPGVISMTGFASVEAAWEDWIWSTEMRSVNGRTLDLRFRLPDVDGLETQLRKRAQASLGRGNVTIQIKAQKADGAADATVNAAALARSIKLVAQIASAARDGGLDLAPTTAADIAAMRGVIETANLNTDARETEALRDAMLESAERCLAAFVADRAREGAALATIIHGQIAQIESLTDAATRAVGDRDAAQKASMERALSKLLDASEMPDEARLAQELALIAVKTDITEELDRLGAHIEAAKELLETVGPIGRKLDFLMQEFNREANTLCSKAQSSALTAIGLDLKTVIDQMREQVQNIE